MSRCADPDDELKHRLKLSLAVSIYRKRVAALKVARECRLAKLGRLRVINYKAKKPNIRFSLSLEDYAWYLKLTRTKRFRRDEALRLMNREDLIR